MKKINCIKNLSKKRKVLAGLFGTMILVYSLSMPTFAAENMAGESVDRSGTVTYICTPNGDGTFTTLEGEEAQAWYDKSVREGELRAAMLESEDSDKIQIRRQKHEVPFIIGIVIVSLAAGKMLTAMN